MMAKSVKQIVQHCFFSERPTDYALSLGEYRLYADAIERGFFVASERAQGLAKEAYHGWCFDNHRPFVAIENRRRTCQITADAHPVNWWLTPDVQTEVRVLFASNAWIKGYCEQGTALYWGAPKTCAQSLAERLLGLLWAARGPWQEQLAASDTGEPADA